MAYLMMDVREDSSNLDRRSMLPGAGEVHVWLSRVSAASAHMSRLEATLSSDELARAARYRREETRLEFILGRGLLRLLAGAYAGRDPRQLQFAPGPHGKPSLAGDLSALRFEFNVSHSHGAVLHAFSLGRRVGVDIEKIRQDFSGSGVARRFFTRREAAWLSAQAEALQPRAFFSTWARKEALLKAWGDGLAGNWERVQIPLPSPGPEAVLNFPGESADWFMTDLDVGPDYAAALVAEGADCWVTLREWKGEQQPVAEAVGGAKTAAALRAGSAGGQ